MPVGKSEESPVFFAGIARPRVRITRSSLRNSVVEIMMVGIRLTKMLVSSKTRCENLRLTSDPQISSILLHTSTCHRHHRSSRPGKPAIAAGYLR